MNQTKKIKEKCPFCHSTNVYLVRHDSDWGGGNMFYPLNNQEDDELNLDIETNYCRDCERFGDFGEIIKNLHVLVRLNK